MIYFLVINAFHKFIEIGSFPEEIGIISKWYRHRFATYIVQVIDVDREQ